MFSALEAKNWGTNIEIFNGDSLSLTGTATYRYKMFFKVYDAALYLPPSAPSENLLLNIPRRLELCYARDLSREQIVNAGNGILGRITPPEVLARLADKVEQINRFYTDVKAGDCYALTYVPGVGTELALNGVRVGFVEGDEFARVYFSIWLGEHSLKGGLREKLLASRR